MLLVGIVAALFGFVGAVPMAGPVAVIIVSRAAHGRYGQSIRIALGGAIAEAIYAFVAFFSFSTLFARHPLIVPVSRAIAAAVLVAVGVHFAFWKRGRDRLGNRVSSTGLVLLGFSASAVNPTLLVTWGAATATLYSLGLIHVSRLGAIPFGLCAGLGNALWQVLLLWFLRRYKDRFVDRMLPAVVRTMGVVLVGVGIGFGVKAADWVRTHHHAREAHGAQSVSTPDAVRGASSRRSLCLERTV